MIMPAIKPLLRADKPLVSLNKALLKPLFLKEVRKDEPQRYTPQK